MADSAPIRHHLVEISPKSYEHPADRAATAMLQSIPMLETLIRRLSEMQFERAYRQILLANSVRLGPDQLPQLYKRYEEVLETLDMPEKYDLYITQTPVANAFVFGSGQPIIVLHSALLDLLDERQLQAVIAHEVGHILSNHMLYRTILVLLMALGQVAVPGLAGLPMMALRVALLEWYRAAELTADRAATLAVRDPLVLCQTMMHLAGGPVSQQLNLDAFLKQAREFETEGEGYDRAMRLFLGAGNTHPFPVQRVSELMAWVRSGEYDRILHGDYRRRSERVEPRAEAAAAVNYYTERLRAIAEEFSAPAREAGQSFGDWFRRERNGKDEG